MVRHKKLLYSKSELKLSINFIKTGNKPNIYIYIIYTINHDVYTVYIHILGYSLTYRIYEYLHASIHINSKPPSTTVKLNMYETLFLLQRTHTKIHKYISIYKYTTKLYKKSNRKTLKCLHAYTYTYCDSRQKFYHKKKKYKNKLTEE